MLSLIWAMDQNQLIGKGNELPWRLPADLAFFKKNTQGHPVIMGRKTFDSLGRPLPNRENIIISRDTELHIDNCVVVHSIEGAKLHVGDKKAFVIGGAEIYKLFLPYADELIVTRVHDTFEGDTHFPEVNWKEWTLMEAQQGNLDEKNVYAHTFETYRRNQ
jgi:dihydrofolate reductase